MKRDLTIIPKIKIHPDKIITYNEIHWDPNPPPRKQSNYQSSTLISVIEDGKTVLKRVSTKFLNSTRVSNGTLSKAAKKKLQLSISYLLTINKPNNGKSGFTGRHFENHLAFITLTLPSKQIHSDNEIKSRCFNQFLIELHKYHLITNYVWRSEYQKNGNIHFHLLTNRFIPYNDIRNRWNRIINKLGYVDRYREEQQKHHCNGFQVRSELLKKWDANKQYQAYLKGVKTNWEQPNSTDIHSIKNISNIKSYLIKYMSKNEKSNEENFKTNLEEKPETGRIWGASTIFANITGASAEIDSKIEEHLKNIEEHFKTHIYRTEYFTIIDITTSQLETSHFTELLKIFTRYLFTQFGYSYQFTN